MILAEIDNYAILARETYRAYLAGLVGDLHSVVTSSGLTDVGRLDLRGRLELRRQQIRQDNIDLSAEAFSGIVESALQALPRERRVAARESEWMQSGELLRASREFLVAEIETQAQRDAAQTLREFGQIRLETRPAAAAADQRRMVMELLLERAPTRFRFTDRAGRKMDSTIFVRLAWRQTMLALHNDITYMAGQGLRLSVRGEDGSSEAISATDYVARRDEIFHPNARRYLVVES